MGTLLCQLCAVVSLNFSVVKMTAFDAYNAAVYWREQAMCRPFDFLSILDSKKLSYDGENGYCLIDV